MTGTGKTTFALHFAIANALQGRKVVYITFEEPIGQIVRSARNYNIPIDEVLGKDLEIFSWVPESKTPVHTYIKIKEIVEEFQPEALIIDSLTALKQHTDEKELAKMLRYLQLLTKERR
ncbi:MULTISPECIES: RAD55 family ATPase [Pyrococcus]|uniref:KaiC-like domain-containing protein n=1 Tax=Pyrococcus furiosus (strain ATCC 43587 / DSM 3638 / JCM 8422 / Vc1) TaxID=186497 RepID=Q8U346_PYRFU|nr:MULTISPECIES: ATPase domain-containing protein [Pyrococcus]AAL80750.1 hypothetical protein PF0626 [Pyrococcus furiosus DSM 3638]MDK2869620.1 hypothetical protein [Pyrococcus sp.]